MLGNGKLNMFKFKESEHFFFLQRKGPRLSNSKTPEVAPTHTSYKVSSNLFCREPEIHIAVVDIVIALLLLLILKLRLLSALV